MVFLSLESFGSHVVGGALTYVYNGGSGYTFTLKLYRDCAGVSLGSSATITVVGYNGLSFSPSRDVTLNRVSITSLDPDLDSCAIAPNPLPCVEEHIYTATVNNLPPNAGGYHVYYQTQARNQFVTNVNTSCNCIGESFYAYIPGTSVYWIEDFTLADGTTSDAGATAWTRTLGTTPTNYARVENNRFEFAGANNGEATWTSQLINIAAYTGGVNLSASLSESGNMESTDSMLVYYSLNGGPLTLFATNGAVNDDFTSAIATQTGLTGSTIQIVVRAHFSTTSPTSELLRFDNVIVSGNDFVSNSNPVFNEFPPLFLCANQAFVFDHSATDADGDSLVYSFYTPYNGYTSGGTAVAPTYTNNVAAFTTVVFQSGYSATNPLGGVPLTLDAATGLLNGTPATNGQFLVGIKVSEYRNGILLSEMVRDFQFNVVTCQPPAEALIVSSGTLTSCNTSTVNFPNNSSISASNFWWNFGDNSTLADTSTQQFPAYTYPSPGTYTVTLITNKGLTCADTSTATLYVGWVTANYTAPSSACINTSVSFTDGSSTSSNTTITGRLWDFGDGGTSTAQNPTHTYTTAGTYNVSLTITNSIGCDSTIVKSITISGQPVVNAGVDTALCASNVVLPLHGSYSVAGGVIWTGGGGTYNPGNTTANATYTPSAAEVTVGTVTLTLTTTGNGACPAAVDSKAITITPLVTVEAGNNQVICKGTSAALNGSITGGTTTGVWTTTGSGSFSPAATALNAVYTPSLADQAAGGVKLYLTSTNNVGCGAVVDSIGISFFDYPVVDAGTNQQVCAGSNVALAGSVSGTSTTGIWATTGTGAFSPDATTLNATYVPGAADIAVGSVVLRLTATNSCSPAPYEDITLTIHPTPSVTSAASATICSGASTNISLTASIASNFSWTVGTITGGITGATGGSGNTISQVLTNPSNTTAGTVQYIITASSTGPLGCSGIPYTITVTVNPRPVVTTADAFSICNNTSTNIALTASIASSFTWTVGTVTGGVTGATGGSGNSINQTLINPSNTAAGTVEYLITPTSTTGSCPALSIYSVVVTVNPTPVITGVPSTASICNNISTNIPLTASVPSSFTWTVGTVTGGVTGATDGSGSSINQTLISSSNTTAGTVEYLITPTSTAGSCPAASAYSIVVTVNPTPVVTGVPSTTSICNNTSTNIPLTASVASSFAWTVGTVTGGVTGATSGSGSSINQTLINPSNTTAGTVEYLVTPTSTAGSCPAASAYSIVVMVNPTPVVTGAPSTTSICNNTSTNIPLNASVASSFTWTVGAVTGGVTGATNGSGSSINQTLINPSNTTAGTVEYLITPTSTTGGCPAASAYSVVVTVNPTPVVTGVPSTASICNNTSTNIPLNASVPGSFAWTVGTVTGGVTGAISGSGSSINQTLINPSNTTAGTVEYLITPTSTTGVCPAASAYSIVVTVNPTPVVTGVPLTASICNNTSTNIPLTASVASSFAWTVGTVIGGVTGATSGSGSSINQTLINPSNTTAGTVEYLITPTSATGGCPAASAYSVVVTVNPTPIVTGVPSTTSICNNTSTNIALSASVASSFTWTVGTVIGGVTGATGGSGSSINQTLINPSNTTSGTVEYLITPTSTTGSCPAASAHSVVVTVNPTPVVTGVPSTASICNNTSTNIPLTASVPSSFTWTVGTVTGGVTGATSGSGSTISQTLTNPSNTTAGTVEYLITPTSTTGSCPAASAYSIIVTVNPTPVVTGVPSTASICNNTSTNIPLNASVASSFTWTVGTVTGGVTGATSGSGSSINQTLINPSNTTSGTVEYLITPTSTTGGCPAASAYSVVVTVNPTPVVTSVPSTASICNNTSTNIALSASVPSLFTWTVGMVTGGVTGATGGSGSTISQTLTNPSNTTAGTVEYLITPTSTTGVCPAASAYSIVVTVNPTPVVTGVPLTASICNNTSTNIPLNASVPSSFAWTVGTVTGGVTGATGGSGSSINQILINPSNTAAGTVEYLITPTSTTGNCPAASAYSVVVSVNPTPVVTGVPSTASICNNTSTNIPLNASVASSFAWTVGAVTGGVTGATGGSGSSINQILINPSNTAVGTVQYLITPTSTTGSCPAASAYSIVVTVNPTPIVTGVPSTASICNNTSTNIALSASVPVSFTWTVGMVTGGVTGATSGSGSTISQTLTNPSNTTAGTVEYLITPISTTGNCPAASAYSVVVTVNPTPSVNSASTGNICNNTPQNYLITSTVAGTTFSWTRNAVAGISNPAVTAQAANPITEVLINTTNAPVNVTYTIIPFANGCSNSTPFNYVVTVNPTATVSSVAAASICNNTPQNYLITSTVAGTTFSWTRNAVAGISNPAVTAQTTNLISESLNNTTNTSIDVVYTITATANGCVNPVPFEYTVTVKPTPLVISSPTGRICSSSSTNYTITSAVTVTTYAWGRGSVAGISNPGVSAQTANPINETLINTTNAPIDVTYVITPIANGCAGPSFNYVVTIDPTPSVTSNAAATICNNTAQHYMITGAVAGSAFTWSRAAVPGISNTAVNSQTANPITEILDNTTNVPINVDYIIIPSANSCATGIPFIYRVTVNPTSDVTSGAGIAICNNTAVNYNITASVTGSTFRWSRNAVTGISNAAVNAQTSNPITEVLQNTTNAPIVVPYAIIASANGCDNPVPFVLHVTVNPTATLSAPLTDIVCSGVALNHPLTSAVAGATFSWTRVAVAGISNPASSGTAASITETLINTTNLPVVVTYMVTPSANNCSNPAALPLVVTVNPTPIVANDAFTICSEEALNHLIVGSVAGSTFTWSRNAVTGISNAPVSAQTSNPISETLINTTNTVQNVVYRISPSANECSGPVADFTVSVKPKPFVNTAATGIVCSGIAQQYNISSAVAGSTFTWNRNTVAGISNAALTNQTSDPITEILINTTNVPVNVVYHIFAAANGCANTDTFFYTVTVNPIPEITSNRTGTICDNAAQNYVFTSSVANTTYQWTRGVVPGISNPAASGNGNSITEVLHNTTTNAVTANYIITPTANGCVNPIPFVYSVDVNPTPLITSPAAGIICSGLPDTYNITSNVAGTIFTWSRNAVPGISNAPVNDQASDNISEALINTSSNIVHVPYTIIPSANGCIGPMFNYNKDVKPTPQTPVAANNGPLCFGANLDLSSNLITGATYQWNGPNGFSSTQQNPSISNVTFAENGSYTVTATVNGCTSPAGTTNVSVSNSPSTADAGSPQTICAGNTVTVNGSITGGSLSGVWSTNGTGSFIPSNTLLTTTYKPSDADTAAGSIVLTLTSTNNGACAASSSSITITITDAPTANAGPDFNICSYDSIKLNGAVTVVGTGMWTSNGSGTFIPSADVLNAVYLPANADILKGNVLLQLTTTGNGNCLVASDAVKVTIIPAPKVELGADRYVLEGNSTLILPVISGPAVSYLWTGPTQWLSSATQMNVTATPFDDATYRLTVTGNGGCAVSDTIKIIVLPPPVIPNVFSPNGDGINDTWVIKALKKYPDCIVQVYTRYGQLIYNNVGYQTPWDGTYNGKPMPVGTYYYIIEPKMGRPRFTGYVVILR